MFDYQDIQFSADQWRIIHEFCDAAAAIEPYLGLWCDVQVVQTVLRTPGENLRRAADREDAKNAAIVRYREAGFALQTLFINLGIPVRAAFSASSRATRIT